MQKVVLKLELHHDKDKQKAMKKVSGLSGVESISLDMKDKKLTVTGDVDPVNIVSKLRKLCHTEIVTVGPAKEPEKKKEEPKKEEGKKQDDKKKDEKSELADLVKAYQAFNNRTPYFTTYHYVRTPQDYYYNQDSCVIC